MLLLNIHAKSKTLEHFYILKQYNTKQQLFYSISIKCIEKDFKRDLKKDQFDYICDSNISTFDFEEFYLHQWRSLVFQPS